MAPSTLVIAQKYVSDGHLNKQTDRRMKRQNTLAVCGKRQTLLVLYLRQSVEIEFWVFAFCEMDTCHVAEPFLQGRFPRAGLSRPTYLNRSGFHRLLLLCTFLSILPYLVIISRLLELLVEPCSPPSVPCAQSARSFSAHLHLPGALFCARDAGNFIYP